MISFKQYLEEGRDYPIYHGTGMRNFKAIMMDDELRTGMVHYINPTGPGTGKKMHSISFSRDFRFAKSWGAVVIQFDHRKLSQRYKIVPYNYFSSERAYFDIKGKSQTRLPPAKDSKNSKRDYEFENQSEESIIFPNKNSIKNVSKYITKVHIDTNFMSRFVKEPAYKILMDKGIPIDRF